MSGLGKTAKSLFIFLFFSFSFGLTTQVLHSKSQCYEYRVGLQLLSALV